MEKSEAEARRRTVRVALCFSPRAAFEPTNAATISNGGGENILS